MTVLQFPTVDARSLDQRISDEVRSLMGRHRVVQKELAAWLGLSQAAMSDRLGNKTKWTAEHLELAAQAFGVHPAELLGGLPADGPSGPPSGVIPIKRDASNTRRYLDLFARRRLEIARLGDAA